MTIAEGGLTSQSVTVSTLGRVIATIAPALVVAAGMIWWARGASDAAATTADQVHALEREARELRAEGAAVRADIAKQLADLHLLIVVCSQPRRPGEPSQCR